MKKIIIAIFILSASILFAQESWEIIGDMKYPVAGGNAIFHYQNGMIYISGGYSKAAQNFVPWIQEYNHLLESKIITDMKIPRYGHLSSFVNNKLYFVGGVHDSTEVNMSFEELNFSVSDTTNVVAVDSNFNRIFSTGVTNDSSLYLIGGNSYSDLDMNNLSYIIEYDMINDTILYKYNEIDSIKEFPEQQMSAIIGDDIYIFGGVSNGVLQLIQKFNIQTYQLDTLRIELIEPRAGGIAVGNSFTNEIFIIGGFNEGSSALKSVEILSIDGDNYSIESGPELNEARTNLMAVSPVTDYIYVFGGYNESGEVLSSIEVLTPPFTSKNDEIENSISFNLKQNYPNPFNPSTTIKYSIPIVETLRATLLHVTLRIYNILGQEVATLVNKEQKAGNYELNFNSSLLNSGIYFYKLQAGSYVETKKMTVLK